MVGFKPRGNSKTTEDAMEKFREALDAADAVVIGAGAGLSTSAGYVYAGGFYPYDTKEREIYGEIEKIYFVRHPSARAGKCLAETGAVM